MLNKLNGVREGLGQRFDNWKAQRAQRKAERQAQRALHSEQGHGRFFLLHVPAIATICAAVTEWYWAVLFCIEATGHIALDWMTSTGSDAQAEGAWHFALDIQSLAVLVGLIFATIPIVMLSMVWLPVQFAMRGAGRWRRGTVIFVGLLANILVIVSGTVVLNYNRQDQVREALVVEQTADANRAMLTANVEDLRGELDTLMNHRSTYVATAASVGAEAYERDYVRQARATNDPRLPLLERALGSARRADELRAEIRTARATVAQAAPTAASQANVEDTVGRELNTFAQYVEVWRPPFVAFICTLIGIFGAWWVLALIQGQNPKDVLRSGWAPEDHRIEDLRAEEPVVAQTPVPPKQRRRVYNPETGREEVFVQPKGYWRGTGKKQKNADGTEGELTEFVPEIPENETGVEDGGKRTASVPESEEPTPEIPPASGPPVAVMAEEGPEQRADVIGEKDDHSDDAPPATDTEVQPEPPLVSEQEAAEALAELELTSGADVVQEDEPQEVAEMPSEPAEPPVDLDVAPAAAADQDAHNESPEREPETREDRLITNVAAE